MKHYPYPTDICKTRIMSAAQSRAGIAPPYKGTVDAFVKIIRDEGPRALFKGWLPSYSRLGPQTILTFIFLEWMKDVYYRGR